MKPIYSIIIPVYNRPQEIDELLTSLTQQNFPEDFEVILVEDGSDLKSDVIASTYENSLDLKYFYKENSGAGASRNFGMQKASGNYFIILDSDVLVPKNYLVEVSKALSTSYTDAFGGPDAAHKNFTSLQKAINYAMTSFLTTGGIRGKKEVFGKFQPRSFNLGISKKAFIKTNGFSAMKTGEDIDLTYRLWSSGFKTQLIKEAFVYHKRRSTISQFFKQTFSFGNARPILNKKYPESAKITYWFPSLFIIGIDISIILAFFGFYQLLYVYAGYFSLILLDSLFKNKSLYLAVLSVFTTLTQFMGYGLGFLESKFYTKESK